MSFNSDLPTSGIKGVHHRAQVCQGLLPDISKFRMNGFDLYPVF